jgi:hypothetical protein
MTADKQMGPILRSWLKDTTVTPPDAQHSVGQVMNRLPEVNKKRRWRLPSLRSKPATPTTIPDTEDQPTSIPALNGHSPTVLGRTHSMFSPVKAITAGALVFALGGAFLITQPFGQQGDSVPGAAQPDEALTPAFVTGTVTGGQTAPTETQTAEDGFTRIEVVGGDPDVWEASDARLSGEVTYAGNWQRYPYPASMQVEAATYELVNEGGRWLGQATAIATATLDGWDAVVFNGEDGYEGLTAYVAIDWSTEPASFTGGVIPGEMPALPEPAVTE